MSKKGGLGDSPLFPPVTKKQNSVKRRSKKISHQKVVARRGDDATTRRSDDPTMRRQKRALTRQTFTFYKDQIERLKQLEIQAVVRGEKFSKANIMRLALDHYFEHLDTGEKSSPDDATR